MKFNWMVAIAFREVISTHISPGNEEFFGKDWNLSKKKNRESYVQNGFPGSEFCILDLEAKQIPKRLKTDLRWLWMESNSPTLNVGEVYNLIKSQIPHT